MADTAWPGELFACCREVQKRCMALLPLSHSQGGAEDENARQVPTLRPKTLDLKVLDLVP